jgi:hypothetical protein
VCPDEEVVRAARQARKWPELVPGSGELARIVPETALFLRRAGINRYGARAFSTLEGYAGRNRETELALTA